MMPLPNGSSIITRSRRHHDARNADHLLLAHGVADDREGLLPDLVLRREVVGVAVAVVDRGLRTNFDVDRVRAFDRDAGSSSSST